MQMVSNYKANEMAVHSMSIVSQLPVAYFVLLCAIIYFLQLLNSEVLLN